jgi:hypothetical protein
VTSRAVRLARAVEAALHGAGDALPCTHAGRLADGALDQALAREGLAIVDTRPPLPPAREVTRDQ